ncbi:MAG: hypothetical protein LC804_27875 [Acidobacteria bacterium]|nr:hypothetical protein [Acidobacteriota bacterium]
MRPFPHRLLLVLVVIAAWTRLLAQTHPVATGPDTPEPGSTEAIAKYTTDPRFLSPWVSYVPASSTVPSPTKYLGHVVGAPGELSNTTKIYGYLRELDRASPRVQVSVIGRTEEGRDILLVAIADDEGINNLEALKAATAALADPRKTTPAQAEAIIAGARPIYYFNAGLHSTETGSPEMVMELAYRLAVSEQPMIQAIRRNLVVLINPVSEPDGRDKSVDTTGTRIKKRCSSHARCTACSTTFIQRSCTTSMNPFRSCTPGTAPAPSTPISIPS